MPQDPPTQDAAPTQPSPPAHEVLIVAQFKTKRGRDLKTPVQRKPFTLALHITNIGSTIVPPFKLTDGLIQSSVSDLIQYTMDEEYTTGVLNPGTSVLLTVDRHLETTQRDASWLSFNITPSTGAQIQAHQQTGGGPDPNDELDRWGQTIYFQSHLELVQHRTNLLLVLIAALTLLEGVFGLREIAVFFIDTVQGFFAWLGALGR